MQVRDTIVTVTKKMVAVLNMHVFHGIQLTVALIMVMIYLNIVLYSMVLFCIYE